MAGNDNPDGFVPMVPDAVIVVWHDGDEFCTLAHDGGKGSIRVYARDRYDARLDLGRDVGLLYCGNVEQAKACMLGAPGHEGAVQVPVRLAPAFGFARADLDAEALATLPEQAERFEK